MELIAEIKPSSPSEGELNRLEDLEAIVRAIEKGGVSAISVLVEKEKFGGSVELLKEVRSLTGLPLLAKGFLFAKKQIAEVGTAGADSFLLMVRVVEANGKVLKELIDFGAALVMDAVVEACSAEELSTAIESGSKTILINNRDIYGDLSIDFERVTLGQTIPGNFAFISASGIESAGDISKLYGISGGRVDAFLVGTSIMRSKNIKAKARELSDACRRLEK